MSDLCSRSISALLTHPVIFCLFCGILSRRIACKHHNHRKFIFIVWDIYNFLNSLGELKLLGAFQIGSPHNNKSRSFERGGMRPLNRWFLENWAHVPPLNLLLVFGARFSIQITFVPGRKSFILQSYILEPNDAALLSTYHCKILV